MSKSVVLDGPENLKIETQEIPEVGPNDVKIKMKSIGVCGSDVTIWKNGGLGSVPNVRPLRIGHEPAGLIVEVGSNVSGFQVGDRVAIEPLIPCKDCMHCRGGRGNMCENHGYLGIYDTDGAMTEYQVQNASCCYKMPESMTFDEGAMVQPLSIAVGICKRAGISFGQKVVVGGTGIIGGLSMMVAKACGTSRICVTDISEERVNFAIQNGADCGVVMLPGESPSDISKKIIAELGGKADVSLDCCGFTSNIEALMDATIDGGVLTLVGIKNGQLSAQNVVFKNLDVRGFFKTFNCYPEAIDLIKNNKVNVNNFITHRHYYEDYQNAFSNMLKGIGMKNIIYFDE